jgi:hypothetical protein
MREIRQPRKGEIDRQKEIWKLCFGDSDSYIDFYFANRYNEDETVVLLYHGEITAMLTRIPVKMAISDSRSFKTSMFYAIATHPMYQGRGFATQLMDYCDQYPGTGKSDFSVLVPAKRTLFDFYRKQGFQDGFYIRESLLIRNRIDNLPIPKPYHCTISSITSEEYNRRRIEQLSGRLFISYVDEDIGYQKKLSQQSGADIYAIDIETIQGCMAVERITSDKVLIKELLLPEDFINVALKQIVQQLPAAVYFLRTPGYLGKHLGGAVRPFGMIKVSRDNNLAITHEDEGYLGLAFD